MYCGGSDRIVQSHTYPVFHCLIGDLFGDVLGYKGIWGTVTHGKRAPDFFLPYNKKRQDLHLSLHNKYFSEKTS